MKTWLARRAEMLRTAGVTAHLGRAPNLGRGAGATWISFTSPVGAARLVREGDGSSHWSAHRYLDGAATVDDHGDTTSSAQLDALVQALTAAPR
jgi:hypothetical protein